MQQRRGCDGRGSAVAVAGGGGPGSPDFRSPAARGADDDTDDGDPAGRGQRSRSTADSNRSSRGRERGYPQARRRNLGHRPGQRQRGPGPCAAERRRGGDRRDGGRGPQTGRRRDGRHCGGGQGQGAGGQGRPDPVLQHLAAVRVPRGRGERCPCEEADARGLHRQQHGKDQDKETWTPWGPS